MAILPEQRNNRVVINDLVIMYRTCLKGVYEGCVSSSQEAHEHASSLTSLQGSHTMLRSGQLL